MNKTASQLAFMSLFFGACAAEPSQKPADQTAAPQTAATAANTPATQMQAGATTPSMMTSAPSMMSGVGTARPTQPSAGSSAPAAASGGSPSTQVMPESPVMMAAAGSGATAAGAGAAAAGANMGPTENKPQTGDRVAGCDEDPLTVLRGFAPMDEDLNKDYEKYLTGELGTLTCATAGTGKPRMISQTIFVPPGATYDGKGETLTADAAAMHCDTSDGEQAEHQQPYFVLGKGAQLENVTIAYPGCEGVHMLGDNVLDNITWQDAGEDAASVRSYFPGGKITIKNSEGHKAADKMFQFNAPCDVHIESFKGSDMGKLVRQNGGKEFELHVDLNKVDVSEVISAVVQSDSPKCFVRYHDLTYSFKGSGDKADRVFKDVPVANITEY